MKKAFNFVGLLLASVLILGISTGRIHARLTGTEPGTDVSCWGVSGAEVCVDVSGNLLPTTDNDTTLGTSSLRWATAYILDITVGDDLTVSDDATVADDLTVTGDLLKTPVASAVLGAGGTISAAGACGGLVVLTVTADRTTDTTNTFTAPAAGNAGCRLTIVNGGGGTITLDDNALFNVAANIVLGTGDSAEVISTGTAWQLIGTHDNE